MSLTSTFWVCSGSARHPIVPASYRHSCKRRLYHLGKLCLAQQGVTVRSIIMHRSMQHCLATSQSLLRQTLISCRGCSVQSRHLPSVDIVRLSMLPCTCTSRCALTVSAHSCFSLCVPLHFRTIWFRVYVVLFRTGAFLMVTLQMWLNEAASYTGDMLVFARRCVQCLSCCHTMAMVSLVAQLAV